jgi:hypothetical protein
LRDLSLPVPRGISMAVNVAGGGCEDEVVVLDVEEDEE